MKNKPKNNQKTHRYLEVLAAFNVAATKATADVQKQYELENKSPMLRDRLNARIWWHFQKYLKRPLKNVDSRFAKVINELYDSLWTDLMAGYEAFYRAQTSGNRFVDVGMHIDYAYNSANKSLTRMIAQATTETGKYLNLPGRAA